MSSRWYNISFILSRLACCILNLANKHGITPTPTYIHTHLIVEPSYIAQERLFPEWHLLPLIAQAVSRLWSTGGGSVGILTYQSMSALLHFGKFIASGSLGVECFQPSLDISTKLCVSLVLSKFLAEHVTGQFRFLVVAVPPWMEGPWHPTVFNMLEDIFHWCPIITDFIMDVSVAGC